MDFEFSDEQRQLREAVLAFLAKEYPFDRYKAIKRSASGWDLSVWRGLAELGVLAINVPAALGGLDYGPLETLALMDACGPSLLLEPVLSSAVIATAALREFVAVAPAAELLRGLARGERIATLAHFEPDARFDTRCVSTRAQLRGASYRLDGHKAVVPHAAAADTLLVSARAADADAGVMLFLVPRESAGLRFDEYRTVDGRRAADVYLQSVEVPTANRLSGALPAIEGALDIGLAALCAEAVGVMQALLSATVDYLQTRQQFGQPIGRFQALQHRVADMVIHLEQARSMSYLAALRCTSADLDERRRALSAAKVLVSDASRYVGQQAVQLHGGMGMTDELKASHLFKRLTAIDVTFGDSDTHLQRYAALTRTDGRAGHV